MRRVLAIADRIGGGHISPPRWHRRRHRGSPRHRLERPAGAFDVAEERRHRRHPAVPSHLAGA
jgi:hypothetical protein